MFTKIYKIITCLQICIVLFSAICFAEELTMPVWSKENIETMAVSNSKTALGENFTLESKAGILIDQGTGTILYEHNSHEQLRPASVTKVMSILLIMEALDSGKINLDDKVSCSETARKMGGSQIWLAENEELTVDEMLKAICVVSANDCTVAMAEFISGSEEAFVQKMNERAKELGMNDTCFKNSHGIDQDGHVTSAQDIALMSRELMMNHPNITNYTTIWMDSLRDGKSELVNTNKLVRNYSGCTGLKTGSTSLALFNLSATATRENLSLIAVIMGGPNSKIRFAETQKLLDYGFANYCSQNLATKDEIFTEISVTKGTYDKTNLIYENNVSIISKKDEEQNIEQNISIPETIVAPVKKGDILGSVTYTCNGENVGTVNIICSKDIEKLNLGNMMKIIYNNWFSLLRK